MQINLCDLGHQAIAFLGTCPICRMQARHDSNPPLSEGGHRNSLYRADLDEALRTHYVERLQRVLDGHQAVLGG